MNPHCVSSGVHPPGGQAPLVIAVVDLGAYTARLEICQVLGDGTIEVLENLAQPLPLGADVFTTGRISAQNLRLSENVMHDFSRVMSEYRIEHYKAIATSAVRESLNREIFLHRIHQRTGIQVEILEGSEEARLICLAVKDCLADDFPFSDANYVIYTIGTGSSQICFFEKGRLQSADTIRLGTLRLVGDASERLTAQRLREIVDPFMAALLGGVARMSASAHPEHVIAVGATVRALAMLAGAGVGGRMARLTRGEFEDVFRRVSDMSVSDLVGRYRFADTVARSLEPCCHMLEHLLHTTDSDHMIVPMVNTRDALIEDLLRQISGQDDPFAPEIISQAECVGERYNYDRVHARCVAQQAVTLFDQLQDMHRMPIRCRLLLHAAALLHDIGLFVSSRSHHKHSHYLVRNTELAGIRSDEQEMLAAVVRYHRKSLPKETHVEYTSLPGEARINVSKMAALLRVADALDRGHQGKIRALQTSVEGDRVVLRVKGPDDVALERWAMTRKADMFGEIFGYAVRLVGQDSFS